MKLLSLWELKDVICLRHCPRGYHQSVGRVGNSLNRDGIWFVNHSIGGGIRQHNVDVRPRNRDGNRRMCCWESHIPPRIHCNVVVHRAKMMRGSIVYAQEMESSSRVKGVFSEDKSTNLDRASFCSVRTSSPTLPHFSFKCSHRKGSSKLFKWNTVSSTEQQFLPDAVAKSEHEHRVDCPFLCISESCKCRWHVCMDGCKGPQIPARPLIHWRRR